MKFEELNLCGIVLILNDAVARDLASWNVKFDNFGSSGHNIGASLESRTDGLGAGRNIALVAGDKFHILLR